MTTEYVEDRVCEDDGGDGVGCGWTGDADVRRSLERETWICPNCGMQHDAEVDR